MSEEDDEYFVPLQDQRVFGAGIKRKRIAFVPSSTTEPDASTPTKVVVTRSHDRYLSIIRKASKGAIDSSENGSGTAKVIRPARLLCSTCGLPLPASDLGKDAAPSSTDAKASHDSSIAHQVCLLHSHPPSHLDREHVGVKYLSSYGWDPDSRHGLGARGEGIRAPIKSKLKKDTSGLGVDGRHVGLTQKQTPPLVRLNAKQVRQQQVEGKKKDAILREAFYGKDLEQYLGPS